MRISRRGFLKGSLATLFLAGTGLPVYSSTKAKKNLVVIMLRGGMDALCAVPVIGDKNLSNRAYGLMQVRKPALDDVNEYYNLDFSEKDLLDPRVNLEVGIAYFAMQRDKYKAKNLDEMIQGYNLLLRSFTS